MKILAIETSCDETAASVVEDGRSIITNVVYSQIAHHSKYGGVVPEVASRQHIAKIHEVVKSALDGVGIENIDAIAVTAAPGLVGALLVGVNFAKGLAYSTGKPLVPVHHIRGHIASNYLAYPDFAPPFVCLVASGGHSHILHVKSYTDMEMLGRTLDDAAGEAFDKVARVMGLGYPGGPLVDNLARTGDASGYTLPTPKSPGFDFSFSGLKTAVINLVSNEKSRGNTPVYADLAAAFEMKVATMLSTTLIKAAKSVGVDSISVSGGVASNTLLREMLKARTAEENISLYLPPLSLCTDNAAMIASQAYFQWQNGDRAGLDLNAYPTMDVSRVGFNS